MHEGSDAGKNIAEAGDEADDAVEAEADAGAGDAEKVVEQVGEEIEILIGEPAFGSLAQGERGDRGSSISGRQNLGFQGLWHRVLRCGAARAGCAGQCYNQGWYGGYSSVAEHRTVAPGVVGSTPTSRPS